MKNIHVRFLRYSAFYTPLLLTLESEELRSHGISTSYDTASPERTVDEGLRSGQVQVAQSAPSVSFRAALAGTPPEYRHFALFNLKDGFFLAGRDRSAPFDWQALEGKTVIVDHFFQPMVLFRTALRKMGVDVSRVKILDLGTPAEMEAAFRQGVGDFLHMQGPAPQQLEQEGLARVVASIGAAAGPLAFSSLCALPAWLESPEAQIFMRAYRQARALARTAPPEVLAQKVAPYLEGLSLSALTETIRDYQELETWTGDEAISPDLYQATVDTFLHEQYIDARPAMQDVIAPTPS